MQNNKCCQLKVVKQNEMETMPIIIAILCYLNVCPLMVVLKEVTYPNTIRPRGVRITENVGISEYLSTCNAPFNAQQNIYEYQYYGGFGQVKVLITEVWISDILL